ncbi:hypothetical protein BsWGS_12342 [Bradybaena similaris]
MGQNSSKRRQRASGKGKPGNSSTGSQGQHEDINGSIELRQGRDISTASGGRHSPSSPTASVSSPKTPEKKEKRKRFRVGFSLKRTPSGRWSRKKKSATLNGVRPVSCPDPLKSEQIVNPGRPQSLFLEEVQIDEDDNKIETVDLSDNEDTKTKPTDSNKTAPKVPEKTKWRRGSNKKSSGKKKKKEKETSKNDKKKKQKNDDTLPNAGNISEAASEVCKTPAKETEEKREQITLCDRVENERVIDLQQPEIDIHTVASNIVSQAVRGAQERLRAESCNGSSSTPLIDDKTELMKTEIDTLHHVSVSSERSEVATEDRSLDLIEDLSSTKSENADSAVKMAQNIIAGIMDNSVEIVSEQAAGVNSQAELPSHAIIENTENDCVIMSVKENNEEMEVETFKQSQENLCSQFERNDSLKIKSYIIQENVSSVADAYYENTVKKTGKSIEEYVSEMIAKKTVEEVITAALLVVRKEDRNTFSEHNVANQVQEDYKNILLQPNTNTDECSREHEKINSERLGTSEQKTMLEVVSDVKSKEMEEQFKSSEQKTMLEVVSDVKSREVEEQFKSSEQKTMLEVVSDVKSREVEEQFKSSEQKTMLEVVSDVKSREVEEQFKSSEQKTMLEVVSDVKSREVEEQFKSSEQKTMLEVVSDVKSREVEEKVIEKSCKTKSKSEIKKVQEKLSNWFHKKDKQPKSVSKTENLASSTKESSCSGETSVCSKYSQDCSQNEMLNSVAFRMESHNSNSLPNSTNPSFSVDIDVEPQVVTSSIPSDSSPDFNTVTSPSASISPISITSDASELESPSSTGEKKMESGNLRKISIGSRLRTAILRKKSSDGSEDVQEMETFLLTPPKNVDSNALTPPPRKSRSKKSEESSPVAPDADNLLASQDITPQSPQPEADFVLIYNSEVENSIIGDDSGFADLTSPESNQSEICLGETAAVLEFAPRYSQETAAVLDSVPRYSQETAAVFDSAQKNSKETEIFDSAHENLEKPTALGYERSSSEEAIAVAESGRENSEDTEVSPTSAYWNSEETDIALKSVHWTSDQTKNSVKSAYWNSEQSEMWPMHAYWKSEETAAGVGSESRTHEKTAEFDQTDIKCANHSIFSNENSQNCSINSNSNDCDDDTRPLPTDYTGAIVCSKSLDYYSPLESAKLISTAVIILKSPSTKGHSERANKLTTVQVHSISRTQPTNESNLPVCELTNEQRDSSMYLPDSQFRELNESSSAPPTFEDPNQTTEELPKTQGHTTILHDVLTPLEPNVQLNVMEEIFDRGVKGCAFVESETLVQKDESFVRTIAEYKIGMPTEYEDFIHEKMFTEYPVGENNRHDSSSNVAEITNYGTEFQWNYPEAEDSPESVGTASSNSSTTCPSLSHDHPSPASQQTPQRSHQQHSRESEIDHKVQGRSCSKKDQDADITNTHAAFINGDFESSVSECLGFAEATSSAGDRDKATKYRDASLVADTTNENGLVSGKSSGSNVPDCDAGNNVNQTGVALKTFHNGNVNED